MPASPTRSRTGSERAATSSGSSSRSAKNTDLGPRSTPGTRSHHARSGVSAARAPNVSEAIAQSVACPSERPPRRVTAERRRRRIARAWLRSVLLDSDGFWRKDSPRVGAEGLLSPVDAISRRERSCIGNARSGCWSDSWRPGSRYRSPPLQAALGSSPRRPEAQSFTRPTTHRRASAPTRWSRSSQLSGAPIAQVEAQQPARPTVGEREGPDPRRAAGAAERDQAGHPEPRRPDPQ